MFVQRLANHWGRVIDARPKLSDFEGQRWAYHEAEEGESFEAPFKPKHCACVTTHFSMRKKSIMMGSSGGPLCTPFQSPDHQPQGQPSQPAHPPVHQGLLLLFLGVFLFSLIFIWSFQSLVKS